MWNEKDVLKKSLQYIKEHLFEQDLNVGNVAENTNISVKTLSEIFARNGLPTPCRYIGILRAEQVEKEIIESIKSGRKEKPAYIAKKCGYTSMVHLTNSLKCIKNMNFTDFKNAVTNNCLNGNPPLMANKL